MSFRGLLSRRTEVSGLCLLLVRSLTLALVAGPAAAPAAAQALHGDGSITCGGSYTISSGDSLSSVSKRAYGDPMLYGILADANWDALGGNPERLAVGMPLTVPCIDANGKPLTPAEAARAAASLEAVVQAEGPLTPAELDTLFGPVALFPDQVLTPVLVATTFPMDVVKAGRFVKESAGLSDQARAARAAGQPWDDSVRELAAGFPELITRMSDNIDWTEQAGEAVVAQTDEVLAAIQRLRGKARENGYLVDNEAQKVEEVNDKIVISPASPGVVYVPNYDSEVIYAAPAAGPPAYYYGSDSSVYDNDDVWQDALVTGGIILGSAILLDEIFDDDDWDGWDDDDDIDWDRGDITIDRDRVNIDVDRGDISIGDGDRPQIGDGGRVSIGDSERPRIDRGDPAALGDRPGDRPRTGTLPASRASISTEASREAARQKIEARRKASGAAPASLRTPRPSAASRAPASTSRAVRQTRARTRVTPAVSRSQPGRSPGVRTPTRSRSFQQPSRARPSMSGSRGRAGAGRGGGGGRGRGAGGRGR